MVFKSVDELEQYIISRIPTAVEIAMKDVHEVMKEGLDIFYGEFSPNMYKRTNALKNSLKPPEVHGTGRGAIGIDKYDASGMSYSTGAQPSGESVLNTAMAGGHGVFGLKVIGGSPIWANVNLQLVGNIDNIVKNGLIAAGIPVK